MISPKDVYEEGREKEDENLRFRVFLKNNADEKELDRQFHRLHNEIFTQYDCKQCRNCCRNYEIAIPAGDLAKDAKKLGMKEDIFVKMFLRYNKESGRYTVRDDTCTFLQFDGECILGDCRPKDCKEYPYTNKPDMMERLYSIVEEAEVCPVVYEMLERLKTEYGFEGRGKMTASARKSVLKSAEDFLDFFGTNKDSPAGMEYVQYKIPELVGLVEEAANDFLVKSSEDMENEKMIEDARTNDDFFRLMRKPMSGQNERRLRERLLENERNVMPMIKERALRTGQDFFIENAFYFFLHSEEDCSPWILEEYENIRSEYMKSFLCLVLGIRGDEDIIPFLMDEAIRLKRKYPDKQWDQGPLYGVCDIVARKSR